MRVFTDVEQLRAAVGEELGSTEWIEIDQARVDLFAEATGDHQWIHVDRERAAQGPFGGTIAHGYLTLALIPWLGSQIFRLEAGSARLNYGLNKARFPAPLLVGGRIRATATLQEVTDLPAGTQVIMRFVIEIKDEPKPACVAETVALLLA